MSIYLNGWTRETVLQQIEERNGWERCIDGEGDCVYRDQQGRTCAAGAFITDNLYNPKMEGVPVGALEKKFEVDFKFPLSKGRMEYLQNLHDDNVEWNRSVIEQLLDRWELYGGVK